MVKRRKKTTESGKDNDASVYNDNKAITKSDELILNEGLVHTAPCLSASLSRCKGLNNCEGENVSGERLKMGDCTFYNHLENIWKSFPEDKRAAFAHLDSIFFSKYQNNEMRVWKWIKRNNIFSKKYVFVPIVCWEHWRLVIFCHFGESQTRCILLLDSSDMCANVIVPDVRKFVFEVFRAHSRPEGKDVIYRIPLLIPKVPQQTNGVDCGRFVLYFIKQFMERAPENFSHSNGYPYFMKRDWFDVDSVVKFFDELDEKSLTLSQGIERVQRRRSQRIRASTFCARKPSRQAKLVKRPKVVPRQVEVIVVDGSEASSGKEN